MLSKSVEKYLWHGVNSVVGQTGRSDDTSYFTKLINEARIGVIDSCNTRSCFNNKQNKVSGLIMRLKIRMYLADGLYRAICIAEDDQYKIAERWVNATEYADKMMKDVIVE